MDLHAYHRALNLGFSESEASRIGDDAWENNRQQPTCDPEPEPDYYDVLVAENTQLRAELAKADGQINRCVEQNKYLESTISRLEAENEALHDEIERRLVTKSLDTQWITSLCERVQERDKTISRLREYARHDPSCKSWGRIPCPCDCGYDALMSDLEETK